MAVVAAVLAAALAVMHAGPAWASLTIDEIIVDLGPGERQQDVEVGNAGDETLYVEVEPARVLAPGTPEAERQPLRDPRELGLLATPKRMVLEPGSRRLLRLALTQPPGPEERIYRVAVRPVAGELKAEQTGIKILVGYDMLVIARPQNPSPRLSATRGTGQLALENTGNTNVYLRDGRQCAEEDDCRALPSGRIYAGGRMSVDLPLGRAPVTYDVVVGDDVRERTF
jgi:P pilus assembly chaperone PapD